MLKRVFVAFLLSHVDKVRSLGQDLNIGDSA